MMQVLINFLNNSIKFSKRGGQIHVHLELLEHQQKRGSNKKIKSFLMGNLPKRSHVIRCASAEMLDINALRRCSPSFGSFQSELLSES